jgi:hypothetical protein
LKVGALNSDIYSVASIIPHDNGSYLNIEYPYYNITNVDYASCVSHLEIEDRIIKVGSVILLDLSIEWVQNRYVVHFSLLLQAVLFCILTTVLYSSISDTRV